MPTSQELEEAMEAVTRLFEMRENYAKAKAELDRLEREMDDLHKKVWHTLYRTKTGEAAGAASLTSGEQNQGDEG